MNQERQMRDALEGIVNGRYFDADGDCVFCGGSNAGTDEADHDPACPMLAVLAVFFATEQENGRS